MVNSVFKSLFQSIFGFDSNTAKVSYSSDGRCGHVHYLSKEGSFAMYYEFGGGECIGTIDIPSKEDWVAKTGIPLERREAVLNYIGQRVVKDQISSGKGSFKIEGNWLNIYG
jgi:hypothetical protein